jgi:hypothetical protein
MCPETVQRLLDNLTKGLLKHDIDALRSFFAQGATLPKEQTHTTLTQQQPIINRLLCAGLIETSSVGSGKTQELCPTFITPRGQRLLDCTG